MITKRLSIFYFCNKIGNEKEGSRRESVGREEGAEKQRDKCFEEKEKKMGRDEVSKQWEGDSIDIDRLREQESNLSTRDCEN